jgi:osmotically-inducible protein OsmY
MKRHALLAALAPLLLTGCVSAAVSAGTEAGISLAEERSLGRKVDDLTIYTDINRLFIRENTNQLFADVTVDVRHARVLLTGNVASEAQAQRAVELTWQARGVAEVLNELTVNANATLLDSANDNLVKKNLEGRLLVTKQVWVINYSINVVNGTAYLLGRVHDEGELNRVLNVTRTTRGVKRVVNYLQISPTLGAPAAAASPYSSTTPAAPAPVSSPNTPSYNAAPAAPISAPYSGSSGTGSDGYAAPELIQSYDIK